MKYVVKKLNKLTNSSGTQVLRNYPGKPIPRLNEDTEPWSSTVGLAQNLIADFG